MTDKITLTHILSDYASKQAVNANYDIIVAAFNNTLSLNGTSPNSMGANFDMNSYRILNLPAAISNSEPIRKGDIQSYVDSCVVAQTAAELAEDGAQSAQAAAESAAGIAATQAASQAVANAEVLLSGYVSSSTAAKEAAEVAQAAAQSSASTAQGAASTATSEALLAVNAYAGVQAIITTATNLANAANALWQNILNSISTVDVSFVPFVVKTSNYTALSTDTEIECNTTGGSFTVTIPLSLGTSLRRKRIRIFKSAGTPLVVISADGTTPFTYINNINNDGASGYLDIEVDGTTIKAFGNA